MPATVDSTTAAALLQKAQTEKTGFYEAMEDDFNTALALSHMFALSKEINVYYHAVTTGKAVYDVVNFVGVVDIYQDMADILGILVQDDAISEANDTLLEGLMQLIIDLRQQARASKDWKAADTIRDELKKLDVVIEDSPTGVRWKRG